MTDKEIVIENEELDFSSERFNPLEALTRPDDQVVLPVPEAPVFDNLGQFISAVTGRARTGQQPQHDVNGDHFKRETPHACPLPFIGAP